MRTTLTLDDDVEKKLNAEVRKHKGMTFKELVNETLRIGLMTRRELKTAEPFKTDARDMGAIPGLNMDCIADLLEQIEGPAHR